MPPQPHRTRTLQRARGVNLRARRVNSRARGVNSRARGASSRARGTNSPARGDGGALLDALLYTLGLILRHGRRRHQKLCPPMVNPPSERSIAARYGQIRKPNTRRSGGKRPPKVSTEQHLGLDTDMWCPQIIGGRIEFSSDGVA
eukprot:467024-Prorocentrum_minimum.AAC.1